MNTRKIVSITLGGCALLLLALDIYAAFNATSDDTISEIVRDLSHRFYSLPFILGIVMGHLFWNQPTEQRLSKEVRARVFWTRVATAAAAVIARDILNLLIPLPTWDYANLAAVVVGFPIGARWWPQALPQGEQT